MAGWRIGHAAVCKTVQTGSIPVLALRIAYATYVESLKVLRERPNVRARQVCMEGPTEGWRRSLS